MRLTKVYFMLWVSDMARAQTFYTRALGLQESYTSPEWTELRPGPGSGSESVIALHAGTGNRPHQHTGLGFEVDDLDAACAAVLAADGQIVAGPADRPTEGIRLADCADTEGNRFSLSQPIPVG
jgi:predicted enzyme related to lactoylglutathione lyase